MTLRFVTGNEGKVREVEALLDERVEQVAFDYVEPQADRLEAVAVSGAAEAFAHLPGDDPVVVEDSGLFVEALGGFPGPYSAFVEATLGIERVWRLAEAERDRSARFESVVGFADGRSVRTFAGRVEGTIVAPRGTGGFGYDPIFEVDGRTLAERTTDEKNALSHRGRAVEAFAEWYADYDRGSTSGPG
ncbi:MAG: RdgB/HAM1 family non-canonical purine NTP pyrophosphatase [Halobacteriales archaeon]